MAVKITPLNQVRDICVGRHADNAIIVSWVDASDETAERICRWFDDPNAEQRIREALGFASELYAEMSKPKNGEYIAIDLDENNRHAVDERRKRFPDVEFPPLGWGVCRQGHGLQDLPPLSERQARKLTDKLNARRS